MSSKKVAPDTASGNMRIWEQVRTTDPKMQKRVNVRGGFTAIDPQWQLQQATRLWGPYGWRWGLREIEFSIPTVEAISKDGPYQQSVAILHAEFFYPANDTESASFPIVNDMTFKPGDDVTKKLITNTRSKALSWLGFSADVFMGQFDDAAYVKDLETRFGDQGVLVNRITSAIKTAKSIEALDKCRVRLEKMVADGTIVDLSVASELMSEVEQREWQLRNG